MIETEVLKREVIDSDSGRDAAKQVKKFYKAQARAKVSKPKKVEKKEDSITESSVESD